MITHNHASYLANSDLANSDLAKVSIVALFLLMLSLIPTSVAPSLAEERATPPGTLVKVVMLSRHGVRSPIPSQSELDSWTASQWPIWHCGERTVCAPGQLTPRGAMLAEQMGAYYRTYLSELLPADRCPEAREVFFWADVTQRTEETGLALLRGFRPLPCQSERYFHTAPGKWSAPRK
jgi:4-phytase / acid phosphatase